MESLYKQTPPSPPSTPRPTTQSAHHFGTTTTTTGVKITKSQKSNQLPPITSIFKNQNNFFIVVSLILPTMASLAVHHTAIKDCVIGKHPNCHPDHQSGRLSGSLSIPNLTVKVSNRRLSTTVSATATCYSDHHSDRHSDLSVIDVDYNNNDRTSIESPRVSEKLDEWMKNSVTEIVKNITQTPLLLQIYSNGEVKTKKATPENEWKNVTKRRSPSLEGVILVEELAGAADSGDNFEEDDGGRAFGVLIQGKIKGRDDQCKSSCYLLKTNSVNGGLGHVCTHFCLMKVQSFHQDVFSQFRDSWLVQ